MAPLSQRIWPMRSIVLLTPIGRWTIQQSNIKDVHCSTAGMREMCLALNNAVRRRGDVQEAHAVRWYAVRAVSDSSSSLAHGFTRAASVECVQESEGSFLFYRLEYSAFLLPLSWAQHMTQEAQADACFLCSKTAILGATTKKKQHAYILWFLCQCRNPLCGLRWN
jgi:hypothetical protein